MTILYSSKYNGYLWNILTTNLKIQHGRGAWNREKSLLATVYRNYVKDEETEDGEHVIKVFHIITNAFQPVNSPKQFEQVVDTGSDYTNENDDNIKEVWTTKKLKECKLFELKELCRKENLKLTGSKLDILERLFNHYNIEEEEEEEDSEEIIINQEWSLEELQKLTTKHLKALCKYYKLKVAGNKKKLIKRLNRTLNPDPTTNKAVFDTLQKMN